MGFHTTLHQTKSPTSQQNNGHIVTESSGLITFFATYLLVKRADRVKEQSFKGAAEAPAQKQYSTRMRYHPPVYNVNAKSKTFIWLHIPQRKNMWVKEPRKGSRSDHTHTKT